MSSRTRSWIVLLIAAFYSSDALGQVTFDRLLRSGAEPQNWLTYSGDYGGPRVSGLDQVNTRNASALVAKRVDQTAATGKFQTTRLFVHRVLYATRHDDRP